MRSKMVPVVQISSTLMNFIFMGMFILAFAMPSLSRTMLLMIIILQSVITLFSLVTLPVELDASKRALAWIDGSRIARGEENAKAKNALTWAALTYFVAALASVATLLYFIMRYVGSSSDE